MRKRQKRRSADAEGGQATVLRRHSQPVAAVISNQELVRLQALARDLVDVAPALARAGGSVRGSVGAGGSVRCSTGMADLADCALVTEALRA